MIIHTACTCYSMEQNEPSSPHPVALEVGEVTPQEIEAAVRRYATADNDDDDDGDEEDDDYGEIVSITWGGSWADLEVEFKEECCFGGYLFFGFEHEIRDRLIEEVEKAKHKQAIFDSIESRLEGHDFCAESLDDGWQSLSEAAKSYLWNAETDALEAIKERGSWDAVPIVLREFVVYLCGVYDIKLADGREVRQGGG